jgi:hypothetical protein
MVYVSIDFIYNVDGNMIVQIVALRLNRDGTTRYDLYSLLKGTHSNMHWHRLEDKMAFEL